jgi:hypothetical protein
MDTCIYGVDLTKKITPIMVRDAIITCFEKAHDEVLDEMDKLTEWEDDEEREKFRALEIKMVIMNAFKHTETDFEKPTKAKLMEVIDYLATFASQFRKPAIIEKHYNEIKTLLTRCESN